jgi:hypothetical protein
MLAAIVALRHLPYQLEFAILAIIVKRALTLPNSLLVLRVITVLLDQVNPLPVMKAIFVRMGSRVKLPCRIFVLLVTIVLWERSMEMIISAPVVSIVQKELHPYLFLAPPDNTIPIQVYQMWLTVLTALLAPTARVPGSLRLPHYVLQAIIVHPARSAQAWSALLDMSARLALMHLFLVQLGTTRPKQECPPVICALLATFVRPLVYLRLPRAQKATSVL